MGDDTVYIACCPEHGLHGAREQCFECGGPVEHVPLVPAAVLAERDTLLRGLREIASAADGWAGTRAAATLEDGRVARELSPGPLPLSRAEVAEYLDEAITSWRRRRDASATEDAHVMAVYYIDAFQSARSSLLGSTLD